MANDGIRSRVLDGFPGLGLTGDGKRPQVSVNLWRDYTAGREEMIETVPGYREVAREEGRIHGIYRYGSVLGGGESREYLLIHAGSRLIAVTEDGGERLVAEAELGESASQMLRLGDDVLFLDGEKMYYVTLGYREAGTTVWEPAGFFLSVEAVTPYIPTATVDGEPYEARNILTDYMRESYVLNDLARYEAGSSGITYTVTDRSEREAAVFYGGDASGHIVIPNTVLIDGESYYVTSVGKRAFAGNTGILSVTLGAFVREIGQEAFRGCTGLRRFSSDGALRSVGLSAFRECTALTEVSFGENLAEIRSFAFYGVPLEALRYGGADFAQEVAVAPFGNQPVLEAEVENDAVALADEGAVIRIRFTVGADSIVGILLDRHPLGTFIGSDVYYTPEITDGKITAITVAASERRKLVGKTLTATLRSAALPPLGGRGERGVINLPGRCSLAAVYDGRLFLSGCPELPDAVFYSERTRDGVMHPGYFGVYQYFREGAGEERIKALLSSPEGLWVAASGEGGCRVRRHIGADNATDLLPRIYPAAEGYLTDAEVFDAILYDDEPLFLTARGIGALGRNRGGEGRHLARRSAPIDPLLLTSDLSAARLTVWSGYLALFLSDGRVCLGDCRRTQRDAAGEIGYEWWLLEGIGSHIGDRPVYRYAPLLPEGAAELGITLAPTDRFDTPALGEVTAEGELLSAEEEGARYAVYRSRERCGGRLSPPTAAYGKGDQLWFGTADGALLRFSTDKRGLPPSSELSAMSPEALDDYRESAFGELAPEWYSFAGHAIRVRLETPEDDADIAGRYKRTEPRSTVIELLSAPGSRFSVTAVTEAGEEQGGELLTTARLDFSALDFSGFSFVQSRDVSIVFREKTKKWQRKRYVIASDGIETPIAIRKISYLYSIAGKVKNR